MRDIEGLITKIDALHRLAPDYGHAQRPAATACSRSRSAARRLGHRRAGTRATRARWASPRAGLLAPSGIDTIIAHTCNCRLAIDPQYPPARRAAAAWSRPGR